MKISNLTLFLCFIFLSLQSNAQQKFSKVKFYPPAAMQQRNEILAQLEADHFYPEDNGIITEINEEGVRYLKKNSIRFEVLIEDVAADFKAGNTAADFYNGERNTDINRVIFENPCSTVANIIKTPAAFTAGSMGGYYTYAEMITKMDALVAAYPAIVSKFSIGTSYEGRTIWGIKISDNAGTDETGEAEVLYTGLQHAREAIGGTSLIFFMQYLAENYASDTRVSELVNSREIFIIPCLNPDGYEYNRSTNPAGGGTWRKNRKKNNDGTYGVDLNRNWSVDWANCTGASSSCGSSTTSSDTYWGTAAFSEPETNALKNFVTTHNIALAIDQHCYGPYYSLPFGRPSLHSLNSTDQSFYNYTAALMAKYNCQKAGNSPQTVGYEVAGGMKDWMLLGDIGTGTKAKVYGLTGEAGGGAFWAPASNIIPLSKGLCFQNLQAAYIAGAYYDVQDQNDITVTTTAGSFNALVRRIGADAQPLTISLVPVENISVNNTPVTAQLPVYNSTFTASFSYTVPVGLTNGQRIRFAWKTEAGGYTHYDTVTKFYNPISLLYDNMEGTFSTNWSATNSPNTNNGWAYTTSGAYQGSRSMAESPTGNYTHSSTRTVTYKNSFNLSDATAAYLSFWVKHKAENCNDKLRIQVSANNGTTYTAVCGLNTISENDGTLAGLPALTGIRENWTRELVDLSAFKGNANVKLQFQFTSNANNTSDSYYAKLDDGFYIDNLQVIKSTAVLSSSAAPLITLSGVSLSNQQNLLQWEANGDVATNYYMVERSVNGSSFSSIATVTGLPPYQLTDEEATTQTAQYRVKQVSTNGTFAYSSTISLLKNNSSVQCQLSPNPVSNQLLLQFSNSPAQNLQIQVTDVLGRIIHQQQSTVAGNSTLHINASQWKPQLYFITIRAANQLLIQQKFIKQ